jgi:hypothetical protein
VSDSWNPPTGPPNGVPVHPAAAKREIEDAVAAARTNDQILRARVAAVAAARVEAEARLEATTVDAEDSRALAMRALGGAYEAARAGQRADSARLTGAAQVFAMRLRDARAALADAESRLSATNALQRQVDAALVENVGRLRAVAAARLPVLSGRKGSRSLALVDETMVALSAPVADIAAHAEAEARVRLAAAERAEADHVDEVTVDDLEREVDYSGTEEILDELRLELGLPTAGPSSAGADDSGMPEGEDESGAPAAPDGGTGAPARDGGADDSLRAAEGAVTEAPPVPHVSGAPT